ncbi:MAG: radical SAM/SPASM domain-containing protein [Spirochaetota bacterium]
MKSDERFTLTSFLLTILRLWGRRIPRILWRTRRLALGVLRSRVRRRRLLRREGLLAPIGVGLSPTMRCNLRCEGCYARLYPRENEMGMEVLERTVSSARECGVVLFVVTGGEPYLRADLLDLYRRHRGALFLTITNGTMLDKDTVGRIAALGNVFPIVSVEGDREQTDRRRGRGVYDQAMRAMDLLREAGVLFGFSATLTRDNIATLCGVSFLRRMIGKGCAFGFYNELIPVCPHDEELVPGEEQRRLLRERLRVHRRTEPAVLVHLPDDEYDASGRCGAVTEGGMHINAQGFVEPCPFAHYARENVATSSFREVLASPFLAAIRAHPTALIRGSSGCALSCNLEVLREIAGQTGARPTTRPEQAARPPRAVS